MLEAMSCVESSVFVHTCCDYLSSFALTVEHGEPEVSVDMQDVIEAPQGIFKRWSPLKRCRSIFCGRQP